MLAKNSSDKNASYYNFLTDSPRAAGWCMQEIGDGGMSVAIQEIVEKKESNAGIAVTQSDIENYETYFDYLLEFDNNGKMLHEIIWRAIHLYRKGFYYAVPNTARMFYECLTYVIVPYKHFVKKGDSNIIDYPRTLRDYIFTLDRPCDRKVITDILNLTWSDIALCSHWLGLKKYEGKYEDFCQRLIIGFDTAASWFYTFKKGELLVRPDIIDLRRLLKKDIDTIDNTEYIKTIKKLENERNDLNSTIKELRGIIEQLRADNTVSKDMIEKLTDTNKKLTDITDAQTKEIEQANKNLSQIQKSENISDNNTSPKSVTHEMVLGVIRYMNKLGVYATYNTIASILLGEGNTRQVQSFRKLINCRYFGCIKELTCEDYSNVLSELLLDDKVTKSGFLYIAND